MAALSVARAASATPTGTTSSPSVASRTGGAGRSNAMRRPSSCLATLPRHGSPIVATPPEDGHVGVEEMDDVRERLHRARRRLRGFVGRWRHGRRLMRGRGIVQFLVALFDRFRMETRSTEGVAKSIVRSASSKTPSSKTPRVYPPLPPSWQVIGGLAFDRPDGSFGRGNRPAHARIGVTTLPWTSVSR